MLTIVPYKNLPLFRILIPFISGVYTQIYFPFFNSYSFYTVVFLLIACIILPSRSAIRRDYSLRWVSGVCIYISFFLIGSVVTFVHANQFDRIENHQECGEVLMKVSSVPEIREKNIKTEAFVLAYKKDSIWHHCYEKVILYLQKDTQSIYLKRGSLIIAQNVFNEIKNKGNPYEFDYVKYMRSKGIRLQGYIKSKRWVQLDTPHLTSSWNDKRKKLLNVLKEYGISGDEFSVLSALSLGDKQHLDKKIQDHFSNSGAMHILAVSGLHVGIIFLIINQIVTLLFIERLKFGRYLKVGILIISIWLFAIITGLSPSVQRASIMFTVIIIGQNIRRNTDIYNTLAGAAFIQILLDPLVVNSIGFQLSYCAVLSIVFFQPKIYQLYLPSNLVLKKIWALLSVSMAAQIGTFPLSIYYFHQFPNYFLLTNIIVIPLTFLIIVAIVFLFVFSEVSFIASKIAFILNHMTKGLNYSIKKISLLPYSTTQNLIIYEWEIFVFYILIISISIFLVCKKSKYALLMLMIFIVLGITNIMRKYDWEGQQKIFIYNSKKTLINVVNGRNNYLIGDAIDSLDRKFILESNWIHHGINQKYKYLPLDSSKFIENNLLVRNKFISFNNRKFILPWKRDYSIHPNIKPLPVDYILLNENFSYSINELKKYYDFHSVILGAKLRNTYLIKLKNECKELKISCYSIKEQGAFVEEF